MVSNSGSSDRGVIVVTGASSGLGRATALHLAEKGFTVIAGVRSATVATELQHLSDRLIPVQLDVTSDDDVAAARDTIAEAVGPGGLLGLVNNAGICVSAPLECVSAADLRNQLNVNVIGAMAVTSALLPLLRAGTKRNGVAGRIVNVSSGIGKIAPPFLGAYAATQFAKEGLSDSLRRELAGTGVSVSIVEPGAIFTPIWGKVSDTADRILDQAPPEVAEVYRKRFTAFVALNDKRAKASKTQPAEFATAVEHAMTARTPKIRYRVGVDSRTSSLAARVIPDVVLDAVLARASAGK